MGAAKSFNLHAQIPAIRYEFASPEVLAGTTETLRKETLCMFTPDEVREEVERVLKQLPQAVQATLHLQVFFVQPCNRRWFLCNPVIAGGFFCNPVIAGVFFATL